MQLVYLSAIIYLATLLPHSMLDHLDSTTISNLVLKSDLIEDTDDEYIDYVDENEINKQSRQRNQSSINAIGTFYTWDRWEKWSKCSTNCVQIKKRKCLERTKTVLNETAVERRFYPVIGAGKPGCFGILKRYRQCKGERCRAANQHLRDEQCERFNSVPYRDMFYNWVGYEKEHDECMLFCRPVNSDLVIRMNQSVTDGTPCNRPAVYYTQYYRRQAVCVEGICRAVHSSGLIRPVTTRDSRLKCGSVLCKLITGIYYVTNRTKNYEPIITLPVGAMNISIGQRLKSNNSFALKSGEDVFLISGDRTKLTTDGFFKFNNDSFEFNETTGWLGSRGPLYKAVAIMYFLVDNSTRSNAIQYNYTLPVSSAAVREDEELQAIWNTAGKRLNATDYALHLKERKRRRFTWKLLGFGACNRSCGPGTQTPIFRCVCARESSSHFYSPRRCAGVEKPTFSDDIYNCNRGLCNAFWRPSSFSECQCELGKLLGQRTRRFECMQEQIKGNVIEVAASLCPLREQVPESCHCAIQKV
ncbi:A disintegrin and metalloproteinase with thrombospondin motifs 18-like isoform X2 [Drosophila busckii]|uniref:A disintegrin and metalloproteinase with thrombospondin motifs 18-like isoform X2 n=1 Tax=Drosophila busckii TaxID=30019 RepID=UPI00083F38AB|nr:A disintegrin and metalloproteinase with thrombospondin motifs 18-like isoform X2 [Drosophila busckii]